MCGITVTQVLASALDREPGEVGAYRVRTPLQPVALGSLAALAVTATENNVHEEMNMADIQRLHSNARISKIVTHGGLAYLCGQTANGSAAAEGDIAAQTAEVLSRIDELLAEVGTDASRLLNVTIYLRDISDFAGMNAVWDSWLEGRHAAAPARTTVEAALGTASLRVEMTVVAALG